jgi:hypothetical protein
MTGVRRYDRSHDIDQSLEVRSELRSTTGAVMCEQSRDVLAL